MVLWDVRFLVLYLKTVIVFSFFFSPFLLFLPFGNPNRLLRWGPHSPLVTPSNNRCHTAPVSMSSSPVLSPPMGPANDCCHCCSPSSPSGIPWPISRQRWSLGPFHFFLRNNAKLGSSSRPDFPMWPSKLHLFRLLENKAGVPASGYEMKGVLQKYENKMFH